MSNENSDAGSIGNTRVLRDILNADEQRWQKLTLEQREKYGDRSTNTKRKKTFKLLKADGCPLGAVSKMRAGETEELEDLICEGNFKELYSRLNVIETPRAKPREKAEPSVPTIDDVTREYIDSRYDELGAKIDGLYDDRDREYNELREAIEDMSGKKEMEDMRTTVAKRMENERAYVNERDRVMNKGIEDMRNDVNGVKGSILSDIDKKFNDLEEKLDKKADEEEVMDVADLVEDDENEENTGKSAFLNNYLNKAGEALEPYMDWIKGNVKTAGAIALAGALGIWGLSALENRRTSEVFRDVVNGYRVTYREYDDENKLEIFDGATSYTFVDNKGQDSIDWENKRSDEELKSVWDDVPEKVIIKERGRAAREYALSDILREEDGYDIVQKWGDDPTKLYNAVRKAVREMKTAEARGTEAVEKAEVDFSKILEDFQK